MKPFITKGIKTTQSAKYNVLHQIKDGKRAIVQPP